MSKQLALSIALSVMAMTAFVVLGTGTQALLDSDGAAAVSVSASVPDLPGFGQFLPALQ